jgi:hypothetical protein
MSECSLNIKPKDYFLSNINVQSGINWEIREIQGQPPYFYSAQGSLIPSLLLLL